MRRPAVGGRSAISGVGTTVMEGDALVIINTDPLAEVHGHALAKVHRPAYVLSDLISQPVGQAEVAAGFAAAEGRTLGQKVERRPDRESVWRPAPRFDLIDA